MTTSIQRAQQNRQEELRRLMLKQQQHIKQEARLFEHALQRPLITTSMPVKSQVPSATQEPEWGKRTLEHVLEKPVVKTVASPLFSPPKSAPKAHKLAAQAPHVPFFTTPHPIVVNTLPQHAPHQQSEQQHQHPDDGFFADSARLAKLEKTTAHYQKLLAIADIDAIVSSIYVGLNEQGLQQFTCELTIDALRGSLVDVAAQGKAIQVRFRKTGSQGAVLLHNSYATLRNRLLGKGLHLSAFEVQED